MQIKPTEEDNGEISKQFLKKFIKANFKTYYLTPELNEIFYLHYKGFKTISNLQPYIGLKALYLQGNTISQINGLHTLINLKSLFLQENLIQKIQNLSSLTSLITLNLSDNLLSKVQGLASLTKLQTLQIQRNKIGKNGPNDIFQILQCPSIQVLNVSDNQISEENCIEEVFMKMQRVVILYIQNNIFNKKISHYRKTVISKIKKLACLDEKPIFEDERRFSQAWAKGGLQEQKKERERYKKQKHEREAEQRKQAKERVQKLRNKALLRKSQMSSENQSDSRSSNLQTYNTPHQTNSQSSLSEKKEDEKQENDQFLNQLD